MWLEELQLTDFRGFRHLKLDLRRQLTVVIGVNGAGKSSVVRAIEIGASQVVGAVFQYAAIDLLDRDVRLGQLTCLMELTFEEAHIRVRRTLTGETARELRMLEESVLPPLCILFKSNRAVLFPPHPDRMRIPGPRPAWDDDCARSFSSFELGESWFHDRENLENQERVRSKRLDFVDSGLDFVRRAIEAILPQYSDPHIDRSRPFSPTTSQFVLSKGDQELTADMLSEGERSLLVLAMTIARRLSLLDLASVTNQHAAVVVIDAIELHLHPKWQREVIPALLRAFPTCQFIITTQSPQVIGSVPRESIVVLDDFAVCDAPAPTEYHDSNANLEKIMHVRERDDAWQAEIAGLIDHDEIRVVVPRDLRCGRFARAMSPPCG